MRLDKFVVSLADRTRWEIRGGNRYGRDLVAGLAAAMLSGSDLKSGLNLKREQGKGRARLLVIHGEKRPVLWRSLPVSLVSPFSCSLGPMTGEDMRMVNLMNIGQLLAFFQEGAGGLLLHAALVRQGEDGVLLIGGSGSGKTTAARRIAGSWRSCCDDNVLVVREALGRFRAHPWPTWSRFADGGSGGAWPVMDAVSLRAMFFLQPADNDAWSSVTASVAAAMLVDSVEQAMWSTTLPLEPSLRRLVRTRRLDNAIALARAVPSFRLRLTLNGEFWETMGDSLRGGKRPDCDLPTAGAVL